MGRFFGDTLYSVEVVLCCRRGCDNKKFLMLKISILPILLKEKCASCVVVQLKTFMASSPMGFCQVGEEN